MVREFVFTLTVTSLFTVAAVERDRPTFGPLTPSAAPQSRMYIWPEGRMPYSQPQQIAAKSAVAGAKDFDRRANRYPFIEWYVPDATNRTATCVVFVSGGGFNSCCDAERLQPAIDRFVRAGVTVVNLTYRTPRPDGLPIYQSAWADLQRTVRVVRSQAKQRGLSQDHIGATGISAGAKAVALLALSSQTEAYERVDELDDLPCNLQFAMLQAPAYVLDDGVDGPNRCRGIGAAIVPELAFDAKTCPICFLQGGADEYSPVGSIRLYQRLRDQGVAAELHLFADRWHGFHGDANRGLDGTGWDHWCDRMLEFAAQFEPKMRLPAPLPIAGVMRLDRGAVRPAVLVCGKGEAELMDAYPEEWIKCFNRGVQVDLHVFSRLIDDEVRTRCYLEFRNHVTAPGGTSLRHRAGS